MLPEKVFAAFDRFSVLVPSATTPVLAPARLVRAAVPDGFLPEISNVPLSVSTDAVANVPVPDSSTVAPEFTVAAPVKLLAPVRVIPPVLAPELPKTIVPIWDVVSLKLPEKVKLRPAWSIWLVALASRLRLRDVEVTPVEETCSVPPVNEIAV